LNQLRGPAVFFGVGAGRCGTMALANALCAEPAVTCTHEGKRRDYERSGEQLLPFLTLQNRIAYEYRNRACELFARARAQLPRIGAAHGASFIGDIAYNYAPFIGAIGVQFPDAKLIAIFRNGVDFVRTATQTSGVDETPVGWAPAGKDLSAVEKFVALGRLAPQAGSELAARWEDMDHFARNAWLWAETNRLILDGIALRPPGTTCVLRFESFFADPPAGFAAVRRFLGLPGDASPAALERLARPINRREQKVVGTPDTWTAAQRDCFAELAGPVMHQLEYPFG
jgi:hypothetical protein